MLDGVCDSAPSMYQLEIFRLTVWHYAIPNNPGKVEKDELTVNCVHESTSAPRARWTRDPLVSEIFHLQMLSTSTSVCGGVS